MERWSGKVAVVTGASSGIGLETAKALVARGVITVGFARRKDAMENGMKDVKGPGEFHARQCDITKESEVIESLNWVKNKFGQLNILVNNAGTVIHKKIEDLPTQELEGIFKVNVFGLLYCSKQAIKLMKENQKEAHIVNINSVLGHRLPPPVVPFNVYPASKFAITALSETLTNELLDTKIRVTSVSPGLVNTPMMNDSEVFKRVPALEPEDVADAVVYVLGVPSRVEVNELIVQAKHM